jgi:hypothetical protein
VVLTKIQQIKMFFGFPLDISNEILIQYTYIYSQYADSWVSFPLNFPSICRVVLGTVANGDEQCLAISDLNKSGLTAHRSAYGSFWIFVLGF